MYKHKSSCYPYLYPPTQTLKSKQYPSIAKTSKVTYMYFVFEHLRTTVYRYSVINLFTLLDILWPHNIGVLKIFLSPFYMFFSSKIILEPDPMKNYFTD